MYFRLVAVIFIVSGIIGMVAPDGYLSSLAVDASVGGRLWGRAFGAVSLAFGVMFWMMNPAVHRREQRIGVIGAALAFGLTALTDIVSVVAGDLPSYGWVFVAVNAVMFGLALGLAASRHPQELVPEERGDAS